MEVGFGRGVGRKGNGMMRERMKTEEKMRWNTMTLEFESRPCNESFARVSAAAFLAQLNPTVEEVADVKTAISEAVTNAMIHGYRQEKGKIQMKCVLDLEEKVFQVTVKDTGVGIENVEKAMEPMFTTCPELERSGMGFSFMEAFMDELEVRSHPGWGDGSGDETENRCASGNVRAGSEVIGVRMHGTYACPDRKGTRRG